MIMNVVGFFTLEDFLDDREGCLDASPLRVQTYRKGNPDQLGIESFAFYVECAAYHDGELVVFRFVTGRCQLFPNEPEYKEKLNKHQGVAERWADALRTYLRDHQEYRVLRGLIADAERSKTVGNRPDWINDIFDVELVNEDPADVAG